MGIRGGRRGATACDHQCCRQQQDCLRDHLHSFPSRKALSNTSTRLQFRGRGEGYVCIIPANLIPIAASRGGPVRTGARGVPIAGEVVVVLGLEVGVPVSKSSTSTSRLNRLATAKNTSRWIASSASRKKSMAR